MAIYTNKPIHRSVPTTYSNKPKLSLCFLCFNDGGVHCMWYLEGLLGGWTRGLYPLARSPKASSRVFPGSFSRSTWLSSPWLHDKGLPSPCQWFPAFFLLLVPCFSARRCWILLKPPRPVISSMLYLSWISWINFSLWMPSYIPPLSSVLVSSGYMTKLEEI